MKRRMLPVLLAVCLLMGILPVSAWATEIPVIELLDEVESGEYLVDYDGTLDVPEDGLYDCDLELEEEEILEISAYALEEEALGEETEACAVPATASFQLAALAEEGEEVPMTDAAGVTITFSATRGTKQFYYAAENDLWMIPRELTVPYFDLSQYFADYQDEGDVTVMHALVYATEVLYLGYDAAYGGTGLSVTEDTLAEVLSWEQDAMETNVVHLWDAGTDFAYCIDWVYPVGLYDLESSLYQESLSDGMHLAVHILENAENGAAFSFIAEEGSMDASTVVEEAELAKGETAVFTALYAENTGATEYSINTGASVSYCAVDEWGNWITLDTETDSSGSFTVDPSDMEVGEYYLMVSGQNSGGIEVSPAMMKLTVFCDHCFEDGFCTACGEEDPNYISVTKITLDSTSMENGRLALTCGGSERLRVSLTPANATQEIHWSSSAESVAKVDEGVVTAVAPGTATITAAASNGVQASVTVAVTKPDNGYTVKLPADQVIHVGENVMVPVTLGHTDGKTYNAFDIEITYPEGLTLETEALEDINVSAGEGTVRLQCYGDARNSGTVPFTLVFTGSAMGEYPVRLQSARVDDSAGAVTANAPEAVKVDGVTVIAVTGYPVVMPDGFLGEAYAVPGEDYTFEVPADCYDYSVTIKIAGETVAEDVTVEGSYTIRAEDITGEIVITTSQSRKNYNVTLGTDMTGDTTARYLDDYSATLNRKANTVYTVTVTVGGELYTGYSISGNVYTIPGKDVIGDIVFLVTATPVEVTRHTVTFAGTGAEAAPQGSASVADGEDYSFELNAGKMEAGFDYAVFLGEEELTAVDGKYTIPKVTSAITVTIQKSLSTKTTVTTSDYVTKEGQKQIKLIQVNGELAEGKVFTYNKEKMFYSQQYEAWVYLDIAVGSFTDEDAREKVSTATGTLEEQTIRQTFNVNMSDGDTVDINDAQLCYDIYKPDMYTDFETVGVRKFLNADVNNDHLVNTADAAAVIAEINGEG